MHGAGVATLIQLIFAREDMANEVATYTLMMKQKNSGRKFV
jgi:hypothetical protein